MKLLNNASRLAIVLAVCAWSATAAESGVESPFDTDAFLQRVQKVSEYTAKDEAEALSKIAGENGKAVAEAVAVRLADSSLDEKDKVKLVWILGQTKHESSVSQILDVLKTANPTSMLYRASSQVLIGIGGDKAGAFFLEKYRNDRDKMDAGQRFEAMQSLAMLQYAPAVKDAEEFLKLKPGEVYWQVYFIFGFFDDLAVPMLCEKLNDPDGTVRTNALGAIRFLMPDSPVATKSLLGRLEAEKDPDIRYQLVEALEWNMVAGGEKSRKRLRETFRKLLETEDKDSEAAKFMRETVAMKSFLPDDLRSKLNPDADRFAAAYKTLYDRGVRLGSNRKASDDILYCATRKDVPKLKELRRRALFRQSDECFYDYRRMTRIILTTLACSADEAEGEDD